MRKNKKLDLVFEPEIERLISKNRKQAKTRQTKKKTRQQREFLETQEEIQEENQEEIQIEEMAEQRRVTLEELTAPNVNGCGSSVAPPNVAANNFEIKPALTQLVRAEQFGGLEEEDPNQHIHNFLQICGTIKMNGVPDDAIRLRLFEFSLRGEAKIWLQSFPLGYFTTWDDLVTMFLAQYFPPEKYNHFRAEISCFKEKEGESISEAWRRFKALLRKCPHHGFSELQQVHIFYNGLKSHIRALVDASAGGSLRKKDAHEARAIIETMASNRYEAPSDYYGDRRGVMELGHNDAILAQNKMMCQKIDALAKQFELSQMNAIQVPPVSCDFCGGGHQSVYCGSSGNGYEEQAQVNYMESSQRNNFYPQANTYHPHLRNHPNLSYKSNNYLQPDPPSSNPNHPPYSQKPPQFPQKPPFNPNTQPRSAQPFANMNSNSQGGNQFSQGSSSNFENAMMSFMQENRAFMQETKGFIQEAKATFNNHDASIRNLETQIGQLSRQLSERPQGAFPSDTIVNPKEQCHAIITRSGRVVEPQPSKVQENPEIVEESKEQEEAKKEASKKSVEIEANEEKEWPKRKTKKQILEESVQYDKLTPYELARIPYPQRLGLKKQNEEKQFTRFLDVLKPLQVNIPFLEALEQIPSYLKFMKRLLSKKGKLVEEETVALTEKCSAIVQRKYPQKFKDPGPFTIPCEIGNIQVGRALCDLGASINLMPLSILKKLNVKEVKPTTMSLQLADRSVKHPYGVVEDLLVKVDKFVFPVDFVVLDMEADQEVPLILGRPFLTTADALIDVGKGELVLRVEDERVTFNIFDTRKPLVEKSPCMMVEGFDTSKEDAPKENVDEFVESEEIKASIARMKAREVRAIISCEQPKSFFVDSANVLLQPQGINPRLKKVSCNEATLVPLDPSRVSLPWNPGGNSFNKMLASNFMPP